VSLDNWQLSGALTTGPRWSWTRQRDPRRLADAGARQHAIEGHLLRLLDRPRKVVLAPAAPRRSAGDERGPPAIALDGRDVIVVWDDLSPAKERRVRLRRLSQSDTAAWAPESSAGLLVSAESPASYPSVTVAGGKIVVAWTGEGATHSEIRVRRGAK
jgi:hypothetical protein